MCFSNSCKRKTVKTRTKEERVHKIVFPNKKPLCLEHSSPICRQTTNNHLSPRTLGIFETQFPNVFSYVRTTCNKVVTKKKKIDKYSPMYTCTKITENRTKKNRTIEEDSSDDGVCLCTWCRDVTLQTDQMMVVPNMDGGVAHESRREIR